MKTLSLKFGSRQHRVSLLAPEVSIGEGGRKITTWVEIAKVWAALKPTALPAQQRAERMDYPISHQVTLPYSAPYLAARRIDYGSRRFSVKSVINVDEANVTIIFQCEEEA